jgi:hypothetical protein
MDKKATLALLLALGLTTSALAETKQAPQPQAQDLVNVPVYAAPDAPMRTWNDYGKRWE